MQGPKLLGIAALAAFIAVSAAATAQTAKSLAGTYAPVSVPAFGDKPIGQMILTADGRYTIVVARNDLKKIAGGARTNGTVEENKMVVDGSIAHYGRYTVEDGGKTLALHIENSTFPNWNGTTQKRALKVSADTLTYNVATPSTGGAPNDVVWKRVK